MKKNSHIILIIGATIVLIGIAIFTAIRLNQLGNQPVAPNIPGSTPSAAEAQTTACTAVSFTVAVPTPTPPPQQCVTPVPKDAPAPICAATSTTTSTINWQWNVVSGATQYEIDILNNAGTVIQDNTWKNAIDFVCNTGTVCTYTSTHVPGTYKARIKARSTATGGCIESNAATTLAVTIALCPVVTPAPTPVPTPTPTLPPTPVPTPFPTPAPTLPPSITAQCLNIKVFDTNWNELTPTQLSAFTAGQTVRFTVGGTASTGSFDQARFTINGTQRAAVTSKRPGTNEFYDEYTLPAGIGQFTINAQLHHSTLGWF